MRVIDEIIICCYINVWAQDLNKKVIVTEKTMRVAGHKSLIKARCAYVAGFKFFFRPVNSCAPYLLPLGLQMFAAHPRSYLQDRHFPFPNPRGRRPTGSPTTYRPTSKARSTRQPTAPRRPPRSGPRRVELDGFRFPSYVWLSPFVFLDVFALHSTLPPFPLTYSFHLAVPFLIFALDVAHLASMR